MHGIYKNYESLHGTPLTYIILYINYITISKQKNVDSSEGCLDNQFLIKKPHINLLNQFILSLVLGHKHKLTFKCQINNMRVWAMSLGLFVPFWNLKK